jgi:hypothetical protein
MCAYHRRCQAEKPLIVLSGFPESALPSPSAQPIFAVIGVVEKVAEFADITAPSAFCDGDRNTPLFGNPA